MMLRRGLVCLVFGVAVAVLPARAGWLDETFSREGAPLAFSFTYGGEVQAGAFSGRWETSRTSREVGHDVVQRTVSVSDSETGLRVRCEATAYGAFDAVEWTFRLVNDSDHETPILEDIRVGDFLWDGSVGRQCTVHYSEGSRALITDFQPMQQGA